MDKIVLDEKDLNQESLEQKIEALRRSQAALQQQVVELSQAKADLQTEIAAVREAEAELRRQNACLVGLQETSLALMNCLEPTQVLETVLQRASELLEAPHGYIGLRAGETMEIKVGAGIYNSWAGSQKKWGEGLAGKVWQTGLPLVVEAIPAWPDREPNFEEMGMRALLGAPLTAGVEVIGVIALAYEEAPDQSLTSALELLSQFARLASSALGNLRVSQETQSALSRAVFLYEASAEFSHAQTYDDILAILRLYTVLGESASHIALNLFDRPWTENQPADWISSLAWWDQRTWITPRLHYRLADFPCLSQVLQPNTPTLIENALEDPRLDEATRAWYVHSLDLRCVLFIPLVAGGQWIGYLSAACSPPVLFPEAEVRRLMILLTGPAAVAVQNLRRLQDIQARAYREHLTREIGAKISSSMDLETILKTTARTLSQALGTSHALIRIGSLPVAAPALEVRAGEVESAPEVSRRLSAYSVPLSPSPIPQFAPLARSGSAGPARWENQADPSIAVKEKE